MRRGALVAVIFLLVGFQTSFSQTDLLDRRLSISFADQPVKTALKLISESGGFAFSYHPSLFNDEDRVSLTANNKRLREILNELFKGSVSYRARSRHVILTKPAARKKGEKKISGYIIDDATGEKMKNILVYDPILLTSAVTDSEGYFEIKVNRSASQIKVSSQDQLSDTTIFIPRSNRFVNIKLRMGARKISAKADTVARKIQEFWKTKILLPKNRELYERKDTLFRQFQFSIVPFIGTNHRLSANVTNDLSWNLLGGYSRSVRYAEFAGLFNIERENVSYFQSAGLFNIVGGKTTGFQLAGVFNANYDTARAVQIAGLSNIHWHSAEAVAITGGINFSREVAHGVFVAGISNFTLGEQSGVHISGITNFATRSSDAVHIAGLSNFIAGSYKGSQFSGVLNFTGQDHRGTQVSAINFTGRRLRGSQLGVVNYASRVQGSQLGLLNIADTVRGIPFGLVSIVMKGYHKLEFSADEVFYTNISFKTGVRKFYNILTAGAKPKTLQSDSTFWTFGYGIGTARKITRWLHLNLDVSANQIVAEKKLKELNMINKFYAGFDVLLTRHFSIAFGITLNGHLTRGAFDKTDLFENYQPEIFHQRSIDENSLRLWWGGKVALRFL